MFLASSFSVRFFILQTLLQLFWIRKLFLASSSTPRQEYNLAAALPMSMGGIFMGGINGFSRSVDRQLENLERERAQNPNEPDGAQMMYVLIYTFGNMCMIGWILAFRQAHFQVALVCALLAFFAQFCATKILEQYIKFRLNRYNWTTHAVSNSLAGVALMTILLNLQWLGQPISSGRPSTPPTCNRCECGKDPMLWVTVFLFHGVSCPDPIFNFTLAYIILGIAASLPEGILSARLVKYSSRRTSRLGLHSYICEGVRSLAAGAEQSRWRILEEEATNAVR